VYNIPKDLTEEEEQFLNSYIESRNRRNLLWVWLRELLARLRSLLTLKAKK
jgi:hypothetical protein